MQATIISVIPVSERAGNRWDLVHPILVTMQDLTFCPKMMLIKGIKAKFFNPPFFF